MTEELDLRSQMLWRIDNALRQPRTGVRLDILKSILSDLEADPTLKEVFGGNVLAEMGVLAELNELRLVDVGKTTLSERQKKAVVEAVDKYSRRTLRGRESDMQRQRGIPEPEERRDFQQPQQQAPQLGDDALRGAETPVEERSFALRFFGAAKCVGRAVSRVFGTKATGGWGQGVSVGPEPEAYAAETTSNTGGSASAVTEKVLMGVHHSMKPEELEQVHNDVMQHNPKKVALELVEDYKERFTEIGFFGELAGRLRAGGVEVVPIEDPALWDNFKTIEIAKKVSDGEFTQGDLEGEVRRVGGKSSGYEPPEVSAANDLFVERGRKALGILADSTHEKINALWDNTNREREAHFRQRIQDTNPDVVVLGFAHAERLSTQLPGYTHVPPKQA